MRIKNILTILIFTIVLCTDTFALRFVDDPGGIYCIKDDNTQARSEWIEFDGKSYYFGADHYLVVNTITPDGYKVDETGAWDGNDPIQVDSNQIVMPTDTYNFKSQQYKHINQNMREANYQYNNKKITNDQLNEIYSKANDAYARGGNNTSYDNEMRKESLKGEIDWEKEKMQKDIDLYSKYQSDGMPQEILDTLAKNIELYKGKIKILEQKLARIG